MRQTLIRIRVDDLWSLEPISGVAAFGVGFVLLLWVAYGLWWTWRQYRSTGIGSEHVFPVISWLGVVLFIVSLPNWVSEDLKTNGVPIFGYGLMLFLGLIAGVGSAARRAQRAGLHGDVIWDFSMWLFIAGIAGARLFYILQYPQQVFADRANPPQMLKAPWDLFRAAINLPDGGLVFYGGLILGVVAFVLFCRRHRINALLLADVVIPSVFLGLAFGRLGCFLNGCCYGDRCTLPWAVTFPQGSVPFIALANRGFLSPDAVGSLPLHPTQIYSSLNALVLFVLTATYFHYRQRDGAVLALGLLAYPLSRFTIEFLRGDELGKFDTTLTISQWVSLVLFTCGLAFLFWLTRRPTRAPVITTADTAAASAAG